MANVAKYARDACGHLFKHYERAKNENGEYIKFGNQGIDTTRSHLNYNLAPERPEGQYAYLTQRTGEVRCMNRADVKVMCSWVVTAPKGLDEQDHERFFQTAYRALADKYGEKNVISAWVHQDEAGQPHLHFSFVPVVPDRKRGGEKVSAKELLTKAELQEFHPWLSGVMVQEFGRDIGIETGELGTRGNLTMAQYQAVQDANAAAEAARQEAEVMIQRKEALQNELPEAEQTNEAIRVIGELVQTAQNRTRFLRAASPKEELLKYAEEIRQPFTGKPTGDYRITGENFDRLAGRLREALDLTERKFHIGSIYQKEYTEPSKLEQWAEEAKAALVTAYNTMSGAIAARLREQLDEAKRAKVAVERRLKVTEEKIQSISQSLKEAAAAQKRMRDFMRQYSINGRSMLEIFDEVERNRQPAEADQRRDAREIRSDDLEL